jgi:hypothetical protein
MTAAFCSPVKSLSDDKKRQQQKNVDVIYPTANIVDV